ncbi:group-specific protein [Legionella bozemanae]|uniref:group-specific protein n=1 Tax=Legionella bozemanae TaxID=447 RepID=UPI00399D1387
MNRKAGLFPGLFICFMLSSVTSIAHAGKQMLLPPWYLLKNQLSATLNADPCVHVGDLTGDGLEMEIKVTVCDEDKARALASFVNRVHDFGDNLAVTVKVYSMDSTPVEAIVPSTLKETVELLNLALKGNTYFVKARLGTRQQVGAAYALFKPMIIQYYSDDIGDWYLNTNEVAAKVFATVFNLDPYTEGAVKLYASTTIIEKDKQKNNTIM